MNDLAPNKPVKHIFLFFIGCCFASFFYALFTGRLNGDFLGVAVRIPTFVLFINLVLTILPFYITWRIYKSMKSNPLKKGINIPMSFFGYFLVFVMIWNVIVTVIFGVGVMAAPPYSAPAMIKPLIQIMNRFNYAYGVFLYFLAAPKKIKYNSF